MPSATHHSPGSAGYLAASARCSSTSSRPPSRTRPTSLSNPSAINQRSGLSATDRALALVAAHRAANQYAVGHDRQLASGWPDGINAVTAVAQPGIVTATDSNTGHSCESGTIILVRLDGSFTVFTTGNPITVGSTSTVDSTVREMVLSVDATTGSTCLESARTQPVLLGHDDDVLFSR